MLYVHSSPWYIGYILLNFTAHGLLFYSGSIRLVYDGLLRKNGHFGKKIKASVYSNLEIKISKLEKSRASTYKVALLLTKWHHYLQSTASTFEKIKLYF